MGLKVTIEIRFESKKSFDELHENYKLKKLKFKGFSKNLRTGASRVLTKRNFQNLISGNTSNSFLSHR